MAKRKKGTMPVVHKSVGTQKSPGLGQPAKRVSPAGNAKPKFGSPAWRAKFGKK